MLNYLYSGNCLKTFSLYSNFTIEMDNSEEGKLLYNLVNKMPLFLYI